MKEESTSAAVEPFIKWAGGKRSLLPQLQPKLPTPAEGRRYFEPFLGGGAVFFATRPEIAVLSDLNAELIETYAAVRDDVEGVIKALRPLRNDEVCYYATRKSRPRTQSRRAARFIYLNKTCFNGLYRVNTNGDFNVPFGRHSRSLRICDEQQLRSASEALQTAEIIVRDFGRAMSRSRAGDVVYFDPPFTTAHQNNGFIEYNARVFSWKDQRRLAVAAKRLVERGVRVGISNADHPAIKALYGGAEFKVKKIDRWSTMAGSADFRFPTKELLIVGQPTIKQGS